MALLCLRPSAAACLATPRADRRQGELDTRGLAGWTFNVDKVLERVVRVVRVMMRIIPACVRTTLYSDHIRTVELGIVGNATMIALHCT